MHTMYEQPEEVSLPTATEDANPLTLYTEATYYDELRDRIDATVSGDRVAVMTMGFDPEEAKVAAIVESMAHAAARDVDVSFGVDSYAFLLDGKRNRLGPLMTRGNLDRTLDPVFRERLDAIRQVGSYASSRANIINMPDGAFSVPIADRSHIKGAVVNNWYSLGGCNLIFTDKLDLMVGTEDDTATADFVYGIMSSIVQAGSVRKALGEHDITHVIDSQTDITVDVGVLSQSLILDKAYQMLDDAQKWALLSCQFFPGGETAQMLAALQAKGVSASAIFNHPSKHGLLQGTWQRATILSARRRSSRVLLSGELPKDSAFTMHDKVLATDRGGSVGTHNYIPTGVRLGTAEMALFRRTPAFGKQLANTLLTQTGLIEDPRYAHITQEPIEDLRQYQS